MVCHRPASGDVKPLRFKAMRDDVPARALASKHRSGPWARFMVGVSRPSILLVSAG